MRRVAGLVGLVLALLCAAPAGAATVGGNPFRGMAPFRTDDTNPQRAEDQLRAQGRGADADLIDRISSQPVAWWLTSDSDTTSEYLAAARRARRVAVLVVYRRPWRDCSGYSAGGFATETQYDGWISSLARQLRGGRTAVILEPDALPGLSCLSAEQQAATNRMLKRAVHVLGKRPGVRVYLDAGHSRWEPASVMIRRLKAAGVSRARGVSLNVSNFNRTADEERFAGQLRRGIKKLHAVIDTSRNGQGPAAGNEWCNPAGRGLGRPPRARRSGLIDAELWVKVPGESDGSCNGAPASGGFWLDYALGLASRQP